MNEEPRLRLANGRTITWREYLETRHDVPVPFRNVTMDEPPRWNKENGLDTLSRARREAQEAGDSIG